MEVVVASISKCLRDYNKEESKQHLLGVLTNHLQGHYDHLYIMHNNHELMPVSVHKDLLEKNQKLEYFRNEINKCYSYQVKYAIEFTHLYAKKCEIINMMICSGNVEEAFKWMYMDDYSTQHINSDENW